jgi:hypothetical protein
MESLCLSGRMVLAAAGGASCCNENYPRMSTRHVSCCKLLQISVRCMDSVGRWGRQEKEREREREREREKKREREREREIPVSRQGRLQQKNPERGPLCYAKLPSSIFQIRMPPPYLHDARQTSIVAVTWCL